MKPIVREKLSLQWKTWMLFSLLSVCINQAGFSQIRDTMRYKQISGKYGEAEGVCLFEDGKFLLYGYATAVFGSYTLNNDKLHFYPEKPALFEVYATHNRTIGASTRINFIGFEQHDQTFFQIGKGQPQAVFNNGANCFDNGPFVYERPHKLQQFKLYGKQGKKSASSLINNNTYTYQNKLSHNDFMIIYNQPKREYEDFSAVLTIKGKDQILILSNFGGNNGFTKAVGDDRETQWKEFLTMKSNYDESKLKLENGVMANKHYNSFLRDLKGYNFDAALNLYVSKSSAENEEYYRDNPYSDDRFLHKFIKQQPIAVAENYLPVKDISARSIFFSVCGEGSEKSYRYKGIIKNKSDVDGNFPQIITPIPLPKKQ